MFRFQWKSAQYTKEPTNRVRKDDEEEEEEEAVKIGNIQCHFKLVLNFLCIDFDWYQLSTFITLQFSIYRIK